MSPMYMLCADTCSVVAYGYNYRNPQDPGSRPVQLFKDPSYRPQSATILTRLDTDYISVYPK